jgi:3-methyladenine DNA glycosylase AlkC
MNLLTDTLDKKIRKEIILPSENKDFEEAGSRIIAVQEEMYQNIPDNKRSSYGLVYTIKILANCIVKHLKQREINLLNIGTGIYSKCSSHISRGVALGILSEYGKEDFANTTPFFLSGASSNNWKLREFSQIFFRKLIQSNPDKSKDLLLETVKTDNPYLRRFVSETLRPIKENHWIHEQPEYALSVIKYLYKEGNKYARDSVGNNLSDLSKTNPELILEIIQLLVQKKDENAYKIAHRASRHLIKKYPVKIMNLLEIDEYNYKDRKYHRSEYT